MPPVVRAKVPALDRAFGGEVNGNRQPARADMNSCRFVVVSQRPIDGRRMNAASLSDAGGGVTLRNLDPHVLHDHSFCEKRKGSTHKLSDIAIIVDNKDTCGMSRPRKSREADPWKQRDRFIELVDADVAGLMAQGMTEDAAFQTVAVAIGLKTGASLKTAYRHDHRRTPKRGVLKLAAERWGVDISEIYAPTQGELLTPTKRLARQSVTKYLADPNTSDEDAEKVFNAIQELIEAGTIRKPR